MPDLSPDKRAMKTLTHALIEAVGGTVAAQVLLGHKSPSTVSAYGSMSFPDRFMPLDDVVTLERHAQQPIVSAWMVERHAAAPKPVAEVSIATVARLAKEGGEAKMMIIDALADGRIDAGEKRALAAQLRRVTAEYQDTLRALETPT